LPTLLFTTSPQALSHILPITRTHSMSWCTERPPLRLAAISTTFFPCDIPSNRHILANTSTSSNIAPANCLALPGNRLLFLHLDFLVEKLLIKPSVIDGKHIIEVMLVEQMATLAFAGK